MGGKYEPGNVIAVEVTACNKTTANHVMWHYANWQLHGKEEDKLAYKGLSGFYNKEEMIAQRQSINGKKIGKKAVELGVGIHAPGMQSAGGKIGGKISGKKAVKLATGIHAPGMQSAGGKKSAAQRWQCLVTGFITNPGCLSRYQKKRGIDTSLRIQLPADLLGQIPSPMKNA